MLTLIWQEVAQSPSTLTGESGLELVVVRLVQWLKLAIEVLGSIIVGVGAVSATFQFVRTLISPSHEGYHRTRLMLSRFLAIALEFQLAADILGTAVAPSWSQLGKLGVVALIRTFLNYFLSREMKEDEMKIKMRHPQGEGEAAST